MRARGLQVGTGVLCALGFAACSGQDQLGDPGAKGSPEESRAEVASSAVAQAAVAGMRQRLRVPALSRLAAASGKIAAFRRDSLSLLGDGASVRFARSSKRLRAVFADGGEHAGNAELSFPERASDYFSVRDRDSGVEVRARLVGARDVRAEAADGFVVYEGGTARGGTIVHRVTESGTEDYLSFEEAPASAEVSYDIALSDGVAGLRLVGNSLEMIDAHGSPRLRIAPPYLVGADGETTPATLSVDGCAFDDDPSDPWSRSPVDPGASECRVHVRWDDSGVKYPAVLDPSWSTTGNMAVARIDPAAAWLGTISRVLVVGGGTAALNGINSAEIYNPSTRTWAMTGNLNTARWGHTGTQRSDGSVLVVGGTTTSAGAYLASCELYNVTTGKWTFTGSLSAGHRGHSAVRLANGDILIAGSDSFTNMGAERWSNTTFSWSSAGVPGLTPWFTTMTLLGDGRVLNVGDNSSGVANLYNPTTNSWSALPVPKAQRASAGQVALTSGQVLRAGGVGGQAAELFTFNTGTPANSTFIRTGETSWPHEAGTLTKLADGRVVAVGGVGTNAGKSSEIWSQAWGTWSQGPAMATARSHHAAVLMTTNNKVLVAGGMGTNGAALNSAEELDPATTATVAGEYRFAAGPDPAVFADGRAVEVWGVVHRPATLAPNTRYPLVVMLHGNHNTCGRSSNPRIDDNTDYTFTGTCPPGYSVVPNHRGYDYLAQELASRGYLVVSINANRSINNGIDDNSDIELILARGRLVLRHLQKLSAWNRGAEATPGGIGVSLQNHIDFTQVGLFGHSRGGEGVRAAYERYRLSGSPWPAAIVDPVTFRAIFEIGPTDSRGSRGFFHDDKFPNDPQNPDGLKWAVLLPLCDADNNRLSGANVLDRMMMKTSESTPSLKATYTVAGANHEFYNTEWQQPNPAGCETGDYEMFDNGDLNGSAEQRQTGLRPVVAFFRANLGASTDPAGNNLFNPQVTPQFGTRVNRGYTPGISSSLSKVLEEFVNPWPTSTFNQTNTASGVTVVNDMLDQHYQGGETGTPVPYKGAQIRITNSTTAWMQVHFNAAGSGQNLSAYAYLDFRIDRVEQRTFNTPNLRVRLVNANGTLSSEVDVAAYATLDGPYNGHYPLQTVRIPLSAFTGATLGAVRGVRFNFPSTTVDTLLYLGSIRATVSTAVNGGAVTY